MKMGFELNLSQTQKLIMTPELRQAIQILQFNNVELMEFIYKQLEVNPFLESVDNKVQESSSDERAEYEKSDFDKSDNKDEIDWKEITEKYDDLSYKAYEKTADSDEKQTFESYTSKKMSLKDHLMVQLGVSVKTNKEKRIGEFIIESLDNKGYLGCSIQDISLLLNEDVVEVERVLRLIQTFDPVGVGARNLSECLMIQLKEKGIQDKNAYIIAEQYLEEIATNKIQKIAKDLRITVSRVQSICDIIKMLEPKPSRGFIVDSDNIRYIVPDVTIEKINGEYIIIVNDNNLPVLTISGYYQNMIKNLDDKEANKFLSDKLNSSMWLIKSIEQRRMTLYKVVESILKFQRKFFDEGKTALKPLVLKDVAEDIGVHESTVSRATNGKYVQTPIGLFELKYFFASSLSESDGEGISSTSVKSQIQKLINEENTQKPLSDQKIAEMLSSEGINISRRTVAKYRDEMRIPSSSMRRRF
ncbi:RNA polymerase factor sigma-54 [Sedimentibacter saalensis]|uniref:RNA polymerase RpoN-/SigL-like sigma 54 subunit n=1 Tax=Sedimentibacter saalensis TaxID=130788 RepID=A0A562JHE2_9FIRM|nr:RNA polymerase factor sigma-54 [Sedimentibacter saalensis]MEA5094468.1 RNA polymerase factor sigma-54 [Sedimentibacter saalensis]TWH82619.1 RNA polymerase RpoN-/SigL-like sigma 54 subunit [Sedimentibacter saalensis]